MARILTPTQPATILDDEFKPTAKVLSNVELDIRGTPLTDAAIQRLAGCPGGGQVTVSADTDAVYLEARHPTFIVNQWRNANYVELRRDGEEFYLYLDYIWFSEDCARGFGAVALLHMAYEALGLGFSRIELLAAGGTGIKSGPWSEEYWGYETWPRLGFDTLLQPAMLKLVQTEPHLKEVVYVSQIVEIDLQWWKKHGDGWTMVFDLDPSKSSWSTLLKFITERGLLK